MNRTEKYGADDARKRMIKRTICYHADSPDISAEKSRQNMIKRMYHLTIKPKCVRIDTNKNYPDKPDKWRTINGNKTPIKDNKVMNGPLAGIDLSGEKPTVSLSIQEYGTLRHEVMRKNSMKMRGSKKVLDYAFTADKFYLYFTHGYDSFKIMRCFDIEEDREKINIVLEFFDD